MRDKHGHNRQERGGRDGGENGDFCAHSSIMSCGWGQAGLQDKRAVGPVTPVIVVA